MDGKLRLVSCDGEVVGSMDTKTQHVRNKKQAETHKWKNEVEGRFKEFYLDAGNFVWSYPEKIQQLIKSPNFTKADITMVIYLATFVNGEGYLTKDNNITRLIKKDLKEHLAVSKNGFHSFIKKLIQHEILKEFGKYYKWNQSYNFYGTTKGIANPRKLVRSYVNQIRTLYLKKKDDGKRMYTATKLFPVFAVVPYLHYSSNIICKNPEVRNIKDIEYFSLTELAELLDLNDSKKMSSSLSSILLNEQTTFVKVESKNEKYLKLNPRVFWGGNNVPDKTLQAEFDMIDNNRKK